MAGSHSESRGRSVKSRAASRSSSSLASASLPACASTRTSAARHAGIAACRVANARTASSISAPRSCSTRVTPSCAVVSSGAMALDVRPPSSPARIADRSASAQRPSRIAVIPSCSGTYICMRGCRSRSASSAYASEWRRAPGRSSSSQSRLTSHERVLSSRSWSPVRAQISRSSSASSTPASVVSGPQVARNLCPSTNASVSSAARSSSGPTRARRSRTISVASATRRLRRSVSGDQYRALARRARRRARRASTRTLPPGVVEHVDGLAQERDDVVLDHARRQAPRRVGERGLRHAHRIAEPAGGRGGAREGLAAARDVTRAHARLAQRLEDVGVAGVVGAEDVAQVGRAVEEARSLGVVEARRRRGGRRRARSAGPPARGRAAPPPARGTRARGGARRRSRRSARAARGRRRRAARCARRAGGRRGASRARARGRSGSGATRARR